MTRFLRENAPALFAILGVLTGGAVSFAAAWTLVRRELRMRMAEKLLDRRVAAHEEMLGLCKSMRAMVSLDWFEAPGELARYPAVLNSSESFGEWQLLVGETVARVSHWLRPELVRELSLLQDYVVNLHIELSDREDWFYPRLGALIRQDFIDFSSELERLSLDFFQSDWKRLRALPHREWHKYERSETEERLYSMALFTRRDEIAQVAGEAEE